MPVDGSPGDLLFELAHERYEGSLLCVGTYVYAKVTPDMTLTVPEGKYKVTAANNGYGGTKKVKIKRDETTVLD